MRSPSWLSLAWRRGPAGLPPLWLAAVLLAVLAANLAAAVATIQTMLVEGYAFDWTNFSIAAERLVDGTLYDFSGNYAFRWSPLAAWLFTLIVPLGLTVWRLAHLAVLPLLGDWRLIGLTLISYPFWFDVETGNINVFVLVAAASALRGNRLGTGIYLVLFLLVPRPLAAPLVAWILWRRPAWRLPFLALAIGQVVIVAAMGLLGPWVGALTEASSEFYGDINLGPSAIIGGWWVPIGLALAAWLTWRARLGLASVAASPYWLPYYLLMLLLELVRPPESDLHPASGQRRSQTTEVSSA